MNPCATVVARLHEAEAACGRARDAPRWAPRSMDLDMLLYGELISREPGLVLPRPDLVRRAYMLGPMAELAPQLRHPMLGMTMRELWEALRSRRAPDAGGRPGFVARGDTAMSASETAAAVDHEDLAGHVRRVGGEIERRARHVFGRAHALQRRLADDLGLAARRADRSRATAPDRARCR